LKKQDRKRIKGADKPPVVNTLLNHTLVERVLQEKCIHFRLLESPFPKQKAGA
jgi:hypothetical protein